VGWFSRRKRTAAGTVISDRAAQRADLEALEEFVRTRRGVEAYVEPPTSVTQTTLLLVAGDGEWTRKRVASAKVAADFARQHRMPLYDATRVGYPQRMREYTQRAAERERPQRPATPPRGLSSDQLAAVMVLEAAAGVDPLGADPSREELERVWRLARAATHPDRRGGDRTGWDRVEAAARALRLQ